MVELDMPDQPNPFVNPNQRGFELSAGCKDLHDVLAMFGRGSKPHQIRFEACEFNELSTHLERLYDSASPGRFLLLTDSLAKLPVMVSFANLKPQLSLVLYPRNVFLEEAIKELFGEDSLPDGDMSTGESRMVKLPLPIFADDAAQCIIDLMIRGCGLQSHQRLYFIFQELN
jgi:hypothetical protein